MQKNRQKRDRKKGAKYALNLVLVHHLKRKLNR